MDRLAAERLPINIAGQNGGAWVGSAGKAEKAREVKKVRDASEPVILRLDAKTLNYGNQPVAQKE